MLLFFPMESCRERETRKTSCVSFEERSSSSRTRTRRVPKRTKTQKTHLQPFILLIATPTFSFPALHPILILLQIQNPPLPRTPRPTTFHLLPQRTPRPSDTPSSRRPDREKMSSLCRTFPRDGLARLVLWRRCSNGGSGGTLGWSFYHEGAGCGCGGVGVGGGRERVRTVRVRVGWGGRRGG